MPLLHDDDVHVLQEALLAVGRSTGEVSAAILLPLLSHDSPAVRGAAAVALARYQPAVAIKAISAQLHREIVSERVLYDNHQKNGGSPLFTQAEIVAIMSSFKCQMEMVRAISMLKGVDATREMTVLAFQPDKYFSQYDGIIAGFQLWDRIGENVVVAVQALGSNDEQVADRAEWMLVKAGADVLPEVRKALDSTSKTVRERAIRIVAWHGDRASLERLRAMSAEKSDLAIWAIAKIETMSPN